MARRSRKPKGYQDINGILLLNKPLGLSSNKALQAARHIFKANKAGHTGSLDPLATGMLPICFGEATKISGHLLDASKTYVTKCQLGITTETGDAEGAVTSENPVNVTRSQINQVLQDFTGVLQQTPPMYSAIKHNGQRLYNLARAGKVVERESRQIEIYEIKLVEFNQVEFEQAELNKDVLTFFIHCSKGTYIRTLIEDIGQRLGCGAYITELNREAVQPFWDEQVYTLDELRDIAENESQQLDDCLLPVNAALDEWPIVELDDDMSYYLRQGQPVQVPRAPLTGLLCLMAETGEFIGIGHVLSDGRIAPKRLVQIN